MITKAHGINGDISSVQRNISEDLTGERSIGLENISSLTEAIHKRSLRYVI